MLTGWHTGLMSAQSIDAVARRGPRTSTPASADRISMYHLDVVGIDAVDVVASVGGWIFDRVMAGWHVHVTLTRDCDLRPLRILGVKTGSRTAGGELPAPVAVAASARVLADMPALCGDMSAALRGGRAEITVWGDRRVVALEGGARPVLPVRHVLSAAARAFKSQAVAAAGLDLRGINPVEAFRTGNRSLLLVPPDLSPV
jgi:hypothetical protein